MNKELLNSVTILYVEDEDDVRNTYLQAFNLMFKKSISATNGKEGVEVYKEYQDEIDLIISDIKMPKLDGIEMIKEIKKFDPQVSVIFTTAFSDSDYLLEAIKVKADDYILKPIDSKELMSSVEKIITPKIQKDKILEQEQLLFYQSRSAEMGDMLGNIAHQWKQPLSTVSMQVDHMKFKLQAQGIEMEDAFEDIHSQIQYMSQTVRDFIEFLQPNKIRRNFKVEDMIEKSISLFRSEFKKKKIDISFDKVDDIKIKGKRNEFMQVIVNLIKNSKDIFIEREIQEPKISISQAIIDDNCVINICDNAGGISEELLEKIFDKNFTSRKNADGTGLGLYMSKKIIDSMGGSLSVENSNKLGSGVEFKIVLPIKED
jgi:signal transduction histidine kinase